MTLRRKEWALLRRDPWLLSQTLMQILYLLPPALLLWLNFGNNVSALLVMVPVLVMASGQLAGGLAWIAVSGEDAPDLVASAPISLRAVLSAKIEAVLAAVTLVVSAAGGRPRLRRAGLRRRRGPRHRDLRHVGNDDPDLVPRPGAAQHLPPPADPLAHRDPGRGAHVHPVGRQCRPGGSRLLVCPRSGGRRGPGPRRHMADPTEIARVGVAHAPFYSRSANPSDAISAARRDASMDRKNSSSWGGGTEVCDSMSWI